MMPATKSAGGIEMLRRYFYYITHWEVWHWFAKYIVIGPAWLWYCLRSRSFWFFMPSNPTITFGGFIGESKSEIYKQLPLGSFPTSILIQPGCWWKLVEARFASAGFKFPVAVKPDVGMMGYMFRRVDSMQQLRQYHEAMAVPYLIQTFITYPIEVSVFYYRFPDQPKGTITGFLKKEFMKVTGDGHSTLRELIIRYDRASFRRKELLSKHASQLDRRIPEGESYVLSHALNLSRGGKLVNMEKEKDDCLVSVFDAISHHTRNFFYGRFDVACASIEDLKKGKNFSILEYNGSGAEPHHVYHNGNSFFRACWILLQHWDVLHRIATHNYRQGVPRWSFAKGLRFSLETRRHFEALSVLDAGFEFRRARVKPFTSRPMRSPYRPSVVHSREKAL
jgi:hypothetical protein